MPVLQIHLLAGYSDALKKRMTKTLSTVISGITHANPETISILIHELDSSNYSLGGANPLLCGEPMDPVSLVHNYLMAMEQRELGKAQSFLAENFVMYFPGSSELSSLNQVVEWAKDRYRFVKKRLISTNVAYEADKIVVLVTGTLYGEWLDGTEFKDIRFIDRFEIFNDLLVRQDVWNDLTVKQQKGLPK